VASIHLSQNNNKAANFIVTQAFGVACYLYPDHAQDVGAVCQSLNQMIAHGALCSKSYII
jgi:hypothetical protein